MPRTISTAALIVFTCTWAHGQSFEVASVKPTPEGKRGGVVMGGPGTRDPGRFVCENCRLASLVFDAYQIPSFQLSREAWVNTTSFDIAATVPAGTTKDQFRVMQQSLLKDRFKLALHHETRQMPIYELVVANGGSKLKESVDDPTPLAKLDGPPKMDKNGCAIVPVRPGYPMAIPCTLSRERLSQGQLLRIVQGSMEHFIDFLTTKLQRRIIDATGLKGKYDFTLFWEEDRRTRPIGAAPLPRDPDSGPELLDAIPLQLGLKLQEKKGPVDVLVIDHIEKVPTEN